MLYPVMTSSRSVIDLSGIWKFKLDDGNGLSEGVCLHPLKEPLNMPVPSSYNDLKEDVSFRDHYGYVFYQRKFSCPAALYRDQRVVLRFEAVTHFARVFLNGEEIGNHLGGGREPTASAAAIIRTAKRSCGLRMRRGWS